MGNIVTSRFVRKPFYVDGIQVTEENFRDVATWCQGVIGVVGNDSSANIKPEDLTELDTTKHFIRVRVHNPQSPRQTRAFVGDHILYTDRGYKIYNDQAFQDNFDSVEGENKEPAAA